MISPETFKEFQEAVKQEYGKDLTEKEAEEILTGAVKYFDLLAKLHHRDKEAIDAKYLAHTNPPEAIPPQTSPLP